jgi:hypothetical protein
VEYCQAVGWVKARGQPRTESTHLVAAVRYVNRLELVGETLPAASNDVAGPSSELGADRGLRRLVRAL